MGGQRDAPRHNGRLTAHPKLVHSPLGHAGQLPDTRRFVRALPWDCRRPRAGSRILVMAHGKLHNDPDADRLWRRCRNDANLRWLLEGVLTSRKPELGRVLLLSPVEFLGEDQARLGPKLSLLFHLTGFPYLSGKIKDLSESLRRMMSGRGVEAQQSSDAKRAIAEWAAANSRQAQDLIVAAVLETVRRNGLMHALATSDQPVTAVRVARQIPNYKALDWKPMEDLVQLFEPFLARSRSKKLINRFTLNFTALLRHFQPEISQQEVIVRSAHHFVGLLKERGVSETAWRNLLLRLIDRDLVSPYTSMFLWCRKFPQDGFVASASLALGALPPCCPSCGKDAHAMASFAPAGGFHNAINLKDGLLGAAIGWHLKKRGIRFWHAHCEKGTEMDFIPIVQNGQLLIECKILSVLVPVKQLVRNVREAVKQLDEHAALLEKEGWKLRGSVCVVNLTDQNLASLRRDGSPIGIAKNRLVSYERFSEWLRAKTTGR